MMLAAWYRGLILERPKTALAALLLVLAFFAYHATSFRLDASADSLLLEDDRDLQQAREVSDRYADNPFLIVTFTPSGDLFSEPVLGQLRRLRDELRELAGVDSVVTILDVPLVESSMGSFADMARDAPTLEKGDIDPERAKQELLDSPFFQDLILSRDAGTTALLVTLVQDETFAAHSRARNALLMRRGGDDFSQRDRLELDQVTRAYRAAREIANARIHDDIAEVRAILDRHRDRVVLHLGGVPMVFDDMVTFIRNDLAVFGAGVLTFLIVVLSAIFRELRWVILPLASCIYAVVVMIGLLGLIGWDVTVISSNFLSLMLIITLSMNIHLAVRHRQLERELPDETHEKVVATTLRKMVTPCLYTALTTIIGFSSLVFSSIKPVQDFGWMMSAGLAVAFLTSFTLFPTLLVLAGKRRSDSPPPREFALAQKLASFTLRRGNAILLTSALLVVVSGVGISRLSVENSFIDYFREDTEIYQGMKLIDDKLGGTTPLEVLLNLDPDRYLSAEERAAFEAIEDDYDYGYLEDVEEDGPEYWFSSTKIETIKRVHDYLDGLPEVGKVLSLASVIRIAERLNGGEELGSVELGVLYKKLPSELRETLFDPYFSYEHNEARIVVRIRDSMEGLQRKELLERIHSDFRRELNLSEVDVSVTGALVLYSNMLQSLYGSQISSLGAVVAGIGLVLLLLFRSLPLAIIGIVPNLLAAAIVLGLMGLVGIPLDMMTITIAAITIGIAVDNGIHYIYRFREELARTGDYVETLHLCHDSTGRAVVYTSITVIFGFSILSMSNFLPTIYFGTLTGLAMAIAMLAALTLLPRLILLWRPFG